MGKYLRIVENATWSQDTKFVFEPEMIDFEGGYIDVDNKRFINTDFLTLDNKVEFEDDVMHIWVKGEEWARWSYCPLMVEEISGKVLIKKIEKSVKEFMKNLHICTHCGELVCSVTADGWCSECDSERENCEDCGVRHLRSELKNIYIGDTSKNVCKPCRDENYRYCSECGRYFMPSDYNENEDCCNKCAYRNVIRAYNYTPRQLKFKKVEGAKREKLFFGMEIEVDKGGKDGEKASRIVSHMDNTIYCKGDGSLDNGFEMVTHPMQYEYIMENKDDFKHMFDKATAEGYLSHKTTTCGLHVHLSREVFSDEDVVKLVYLFEKHWDKIVKFSRRASGNLGYSARYGEEEVSDIEKMNIKTGSLDKIKKFKDSGRYRAVNLSNTNTVEIRVFRGTLNVDTFIASIQFCDILTTAVIENDIDRLRTWDWNALMASSVSYPELDAYLEIRGLK